MKIPLIDLKAQYLSVKEEINNAVLEVLESGNYILGPNVKALEEEIASYCNTKYGIGVANGTDALVLSLLAFGIGKGDEVITSPFTFFATAEAISQVGATPVFVDVDQRTYNINPNQIEEKINEKTKAIIPVHIFGQMADMDPIMKIAEEHNLTVIEDACQAIGAEYKGKKAGSIGHASCFSFFPTKNLGGFGDGGMVVTNNENAMEKIKVLRVHGSKPKYYHSLLGYNSRLDEIQAAALRVNLKYIDQWNNQRVQKVNLYNKLLKNTDLTLPYEEYFNKHVYHLYIVRSTKRKKIMDMLKGNDIGCGIYYPVPLHLQGVYKELGYNEGDLTVAEEAASETFALPMFPEITEKQIKATVEIILNEI
jgi:dTDP-4-amino-4,6-dideoxygalactose transaminase